MRIYALVSCFEPLKIYLFKEGLVRFATQKYTTNQKATDRKYVHLTNYSINKKNEDYVKNTGNNVKTGENGDDPDDENEESASKWNLA
jgi:tubulin polyglutamylase TTLL4